MKKKTGVQKILAMLLVFVMTMSLTACGETGSTGSGDSGGKAEADPNAALAKQYVFSHQTIDMGVDSDDIGVRAITKMNDRLYMVVELYDWNSSGSQNEVMVVSTDLQGGDVQKTPLELPGASAEEDAEDNGEDAAEGEDVAEDVAGEVINAEALAAAEVTADTLIDDDFAVGDTFEEVTSYEYVGFGSFSLTEDGHVYGLRTRTFEDWSNPEEYISETTNSICSWGLDGKLFWEKELENLTTEDQYFYVEKIATLEDGSVVILIGGDGYFKIEMDAEGNMSERQPLNALTEKSVNSNQTMYKGNGEFLLTYYDDEWTKIFMASYDIKTDTVGEETQLPENMMASGFNSMAVGASTDLVYTTNNGVYGLSVGATEASQIMSFINSDMSVNYMNQIVMLDDEHFVGVYSDELNDYKTVASVFTKKNPEDIPDKAVLTLAANYIGSAVRKRVVNFNQNSDTYRIVLKEYQSYATQDDYLAGYTQLNNDIISGNMPDILVYDNYLPVENYISKGLIADIGELMAKDPEISQIAYMENAFNAYKVNDKLYHIIPGFQVRSMAAKTANVGDRTSWTFADLKEIMASMPEGSQSFSEMTQGMFINNVMFYCGSDFVDASTGKCAFDSQDFISMLEFAADLPAEISYENNDEYWNNYWENYQSQYREDRTLLMECYISSVRDMNYTINGYFGEDVSFVGFPTESGKGSVLNASDNTFLLSAKSKNLEGAWEFSRYYLTEEYQSSGDNWALPTIKSLFLTKAEEALEKPYYLDEDGNKVEYDESFDMNGETIPLEPMTREQVDEVVAMIESVDKVMYYNEDIQNIITEETASFFDGQKSAAEVAQIIQSRAQIYVDENR